MGKKCKSYCVFSHVQTDIVKPVNKINWINENTKVIKYYTNVPRLARTLLTFIIFLS